MEPEVRVATEAELEPIWSMLCRAFNWSAADVERFVAESEDGRVRAVFVDGEPVATSRIRSFGQFLGGRSVPLAGYSPVGVAPDHRGRGYGSVITTAHYADLRDRGEVVAGLYPATTSLYRKAGFELAGAWTMHSLRTRDLQRLPPAPGVTVRRATEEDSAAIQACYRRVAPTVHGFLDRPERWWRRLLRFDDVHVYVVDGQGGELDGYVRYTHGRGPQGGFQFRINVAELITTEPDVALALWHTVGSSSTVAPDTSVIGPPEHPLLLLLPEQDLKTTNELRWMIRLVDAPGAVAARGYPPGVTAAVDLEVDDRHCDWNRGRWRLTVEGGHGTLERGGDGSVRVGIGALSSLYAGYAGPHRLAAAGLLQGGSPSELAALEAVFSGPTPWMADFY